MTFGRTFGDRSRLFHVLDKTFITFIYFTISIIFQKFNFFENIYYR